MKHLVPKLVGMGKRTRESQDEGASASGAAESSWPPSSAPAEASGAGADAAAEASRAPTMRPSAAAPAASSPSSAAAAANAPSEDEAGHRASGFTSVLRDLSLRGWLCWIHSHGSSATLQVHALEGGSGKVWCSGGDVIDAEWDGRGPEQALRDMLALPSGAVSIDIGRTDRVRRIFRSTHELLEIGGGEAFAASPAIRAEAGAPASAAGSVRSELFRHSRWLATGTPPAPAGATSRRPKPQGRRFSRGEYLAGVLVAGLAILGFSFGRWRASNDSDQTEAAEAPGTQQSRSSLRPPAPAGAPSVVPSIPPEPQELPLIPFATLEVEPAHAQIWLDRELIGAGRVQLGAIQDGTLHELRFVAPEHEAKALFFRGTPPAGRVLLKRIQDNGSGPALAPGVRVTRAPAPSAHTGAADTALGGGKPAEAEHDARKKLAQRRPPAPVTTQAAPRAGAEAAAPAVEPPPKKPRSIQLIEVHTPRVQVVD